ncbi:MAG: mevalonate kinase, partial [Candidatus Heimdallarchaeota archaeon]|nr:mevalonate kinase [Candidatus Heimdallarchaeota archaeon]
MDTKETIFSAPGKIILFGEHAVVYGYPAIVSAINLKTKCIIKESHLNEVQLSISSNYLLSKSSDSNMLNYIINHENREFEPKTKVSQRSVNPAYYFIVEKILNMTTSQKSPFIHIDSEIPPGIGLGSSAANAVAVIASLSSFMNINLSLAELNEFAFEAEKIIHGKPSGVDNTVSTYGGIQHYKQKKFTKLSVPDIDTHIVIVNSGIQRNTKHYIEKVADLMEENPEKYQNILEQIGKLTLNAKSSLLKGEVKELGNRMKQNHLLLNELGVGHPILDELVDSLDHYGSLGSKLTGAGGGGCIISLFE